MGNKLNPPCLWLPEADCSASTYNILCGAPASEAVFQLPGPIPSSRPSRVTRTPEFVVVVRLELREPPEAVPPTRPKQKRKPKPRKLRMTGQKDVEGSQSLEKSQAGGDHVRAVLK